MHPAAASAGFGPEHGAPCPSQSRSALFSDGCSAPFLGIAPDDTALSTVVAHACTSQHADHKVP
jgi:hypothetical protein